jgi:hypothetical protein
MIWGPKCRPIYRSPQGGVETLLKHCCVWFVTLFEENWRLVTNEPAEFEKQPVEVGDLRRITDCFRRIYRLYLKWKKAYQKMPTCNWLDLESLGSWPTVYARKLPGHSSVTQLHYIATQPCKSNYISYRTCRHVQQNQKHVLPWPKVVCWELLYKLVYVLHLLLWPTVILRYHNNFYWCEIS